MICAITSLHGCWWAAIGFLAWCPARRDADVRIGRIRARSLVPGGAGPRHDLQCQLLPQRDDPLAAEQRAQPPCSVRAAALQRLPDRTQADQGRGLDVVKADDR